MLNPALLLRPQQGNILFLIHPCTDFLIVPLLKQYNYICIASHRILLYKPYITKQMHFAVFLHHTDFQDEKQGIFMLSPNYLTSLPMHVPLTTSMEHAHYIIVQAY